MRTLNRDTYCAVALLAFCGLYYWASTRIPDMGYETLGSAVWPRVVLAPLVVLSLLYLVRSLRGPLGEPEEPAPARRPGPAGWLLAHLNVLASFVLFGLYLATLPYLGMLIGGAAFVFAMLTVLGPLDARSLVAHAAIALLTVGGMWALFTYGLNVILPGGELLRLQ